MKLWVNWKNDGTCSVHTDEQELISQILELAEEYSGQVQIEKKPSDNDGMIVASLPNEWVGITRPMEVQD